jgi:hypothetical protein
MSEPIRGMSKLLRKLNSLRELRGAKRGLRAGAVHIKGKIAIYANSSEANTPNQRRWYERGYGPKWLRKDGSMGSRKTSETLGRKWTTESRNNGLTQVVGNNVSYAPYVQSEENQAGFHKARGWKTDVQVIDEEGPRVLEFVKDEVDKELEGD